MVIKIKINDMLEDGSLLRNISLFEREEKINQLLK